MPFKFNPFTGTLDLVGTASGGAGIDTINTIGPDGSGNFTVSAGPGISIAGGVNSITVSSTGAGFAWSDKNSAFNAAASNGYNIFGSCTATLPASPADGDTIEFFVDGAFTLTVQANTGQTIQIATNISSSAGTQTNTASGDALSIHYRASDTKWCADSFVGVWNKT